MRILELEITDMRGIKSLTLKPNGKNMVISGRNGSGKSGVVDALDFLLTGKILRLTGKGTGGISLSTHGGHVDCDSSSAKVRALIEVPGLSDPVQIERCLNKPGDLKCAISVQTALNPVIQLAQRGQHVLTRREILRYITSEASTRSQEIQDLLNISDIEAVRKTLVKVNNECDQSRKNAQQALNTAEGHVSSLVGSTRFDPGQTLLTINTNRAVLGGGPVSEISSRSLKSGIALPSAQGGKHTINTSVVRQQMETLRSYSADIPDIVSKDGKLRDFLTKIRANPDLRKALNLQDLTQMGLELLGDDGSCPLCEATYPAGELEKKLRSRLESAEIAKKYQEDIDELANSISRYGAALLPILRQLIAIANQMQLDILAQQLGQWQNRVNAFLRAMESPARSYVATEFSSSAVGRLFGPAHDDLMSLLDDFEKTVVAQYPETTPEQTSWDLLTKLEIQVSDLESARERLTSARLTAQRASALLRSFENARDEILGKLYDEIKDRFVGLYKSLHGEDEASFDARLEPEGAALQFEVDFYGRGKYPPHALHSEGHQDSMGLCLYLALTERLGKGKFDLLILDDVVMSVDSDHRRELCRVLNQEFPGRQFLITTHDRNWAKQLHTEGVVNQKGSVEFFNWSLETGPLLDYEHDMWGEITDLIDRNKIPTAAAALRRGLEQFFAYRCDALHAQVRFKLEGRWEFGELASSANGRFKKLINKAKIAANSWDKRGLVQELNELDKALSLAMQQSGMESWAVNSNVHYNAWTDFGKKDFVPVVDAFQSMLELHKCHSCDSHLYLTVNGMKEDSLRCSCGAMNYSLVEKDGR
jgi:energy-coupling factor transporter ATP-binding protein EcfA2